MDSKVDNFNKIFGADATLLRSKWSEQLQETAVAIHHSKLSTNDGELSTNVDNIKAQDDRDVIIFYKNAATANARITDSVERSIFRDSTCNINAATMTLAQLQKVSLDDNVVSVSMDNVMYPC